MHRFFVDRNQVEEDIIYIQGKDVKHIRDVLRLKIDERVEVSSEGFNYLCRIKDMTRDEVLLDILSKEKGRSEPNIDIILYQGLAKGSKMDLIIQKGTEIGIREFVGLLSHRTIVKISDIKKEAKKIDRWNMIAEEAAKQSKRDYIPIFSNIQSFDGMIQVLKDEDNIIVAYEDEDFQTMGDALRDMEGHKINLIIGPEGGFEVEEIQKLKDIGAKIVSLGPRILRTETAGLVASTIILYELGKIGVI